jgi:hypothetical protein
MVGKIREIPGTIYQIFSTVFIFFGIYGKRDGNGMCYYENGTVNGETYLPPVFGILGKIRYFSRILTVFFRSTKKTKEVRTILVRV